MSTAPGRWEALRLRAGGLAVQGLLEGASRLAGLAPQANPARYGIRVLRDRRYGPETPAHLYDVWIPATPRPDRAVVLHIHGGGFRILSKDTHWLMALQFARRGFLVFNINYRLAPTHGFPAPVEDCARAWQEVLATAKSLGGDPQRVVVAGESAGGNLTAALTLMTSFERPEAFAQDAFATGVAPRAAVPFCAMLESSDPDSLCEGVRSQFIRDRIRMVSGQYLDRRPAGIALDLADPLAVLEGDATPARPLPPFFAPCGTADPLLGQHRRLQQALGRRGVRCATPEFPGGIHAFHAFLWQQIARDAWAQTFAFLDDVLAAPQPA
jgi:acetyl esterase